MPWPSGMWITVAAGNADDMVGLSAGRPGAARRRRLYWWVLLHACPHSTVASPMPPSLNDFIRQIEESGIISAESLRPFLPRHAGPSAARDLALELVRRKKLTRYQAEEAFKGRARRLVLGNYVLLDRIGAGGMGQVFKARHRRMEREVAIKLLSPEVVRQPGAIARFEREVKAAARISHPNIITAHDADEADGLHFLVMEYVAGVDLSHLVKKQGPQTVALSLDIVLQAARGLEAAHGVGVIHRDIKPGNLLLDASGTVKILDMGLARLDSQAMNRDAPELTTTGAVMGTVDYMAPEQALDAKSADARADIYALGCTLHWLLTGKAPYDGDTLMARLLAHRDRPIPRIVGPSGPVPEAVDQVFRRMVAKTPEARYPSMAAVVADLERLRADHSALSPSSTTLIFEDTLDVLPAFSDSKPTPDSSSSRRPASQRPFQRDPRRNRRVIIAAGVTGAVIIAGVVISIPRSKGPSAVTSRRSDDARRGSRATEQADGLGGGAGKDPPPTLAAVPSVRSAGGSESASGAPGSELAFQRAGFDRWLTSVANLPTEEQVEEVRRKMAECNPGFDPTTLTAQFEGRVVRAITFSSMQVTDLSPLRAFSGLRFLFMEGQPSPVSPLVDLAPLQGLSLRILSAGFTNVSDLRPLAGMPLTEIKLGRTRVSSLEPLRGMPLERLSLDGCPLEGLDPLDGMPIRYLSIPSTGVEDLGPLRGSEIETLICGDNPLDDLSPLAGAPLVDLAIESTGVSDLAPLHASSLRRLFISYSKVADLSPVAGKPLVWLSIAHTPITSLEPLRGAPLENLSYEAAPVTNVTVLAGMPLTHVTMTYEAERDGAVLRGIQSLERINGKPVAEFWREQTSSR